MVARSSSRSSSSRCSASRCRNVREDAMSARSRAWSSSVITIFFEAIFSSFAVVPLRLSGCTDGLAPSSCVAGAIQFATEEPSYTTGGTVDSGENVRVGLVHRDAAEWQHVGADPAAGTRRAFGADTYGDIADAATETAECKLQATLDVGSECDGDVRFVDVVSDVHRSSSSPVRNVEEVRMLRKGLNCCD